MSTDADKFGKMSWLIFTLAQWSWAMASLPVVVYFIYSIMGVAAL